MQRFLGELVDRKRIAIEHHGARRASTITICNYDRYQLSGTASEPPLRTANVTANESQVVEVEVEVKQVDPSLRSGSSRPAADSGGDGRIEELHRYFNEKRQGQELQLTPGRKSKYRARLKTFSMDAIMRAIESATVNPFYLGQNNRETRYDYPETVLKSDEAVERHIEWAQKELSRGRLREDVREGLQWLA